MPSAIKRQIKEPVNECQVYCRGKSKRDLASARVERAGAQSKADGGLAPAVPVPICLQGLHLRSLFWRTLGLSDDLLLSKISGLMLKVMGLTV